MGTLLSRHFGLLSLAFWAVLIAFLGDISLAGSKTCGGVNFLRTNGGPLVGCRAVALAVIEWKLTCVDDEMHQWCKITGELHRQPGKDRSRKPLGFAISRSRVERLGTPWI
jgi:hypothetical protein